MISIVIGLFALRAHSQQQAPSPTLTNLEQAYQLALKVEDYRIKNESVQGQARAKLSQARSYLYPHLNGEGIYSETRFEDKNTNLETDSHKKTIGLNLRQTLFQGGLFSGIDREKAGRDISNLQIQKNNLSLYLQVSQSYYRITLLESTLDVLSEIDGVSNRRVTNMKRRVRIGKSKQTDLLTNELQNQEIKIQLGQVQANLANEKEIFSRLTGLSNSVVLVKNESIPSLKPLAYYLEKISQTPDIQIQSKTAFIADKNESILSGQHLPKLYLDLDARYGELSSTQEGKEYAAMLTLQIPLFEGGRVRAETQEAQWVKKQEQARLQGLNQDVVVAIKNQHASLTKNLELFKVYETSLATARKSYQIFNKELGLGLVDNLELLNSISSYLTAKKNREEAFFQIKLSELNLAQLVGERN